MSDAVVVALIVNGVPVVTALCGLAYKALAARVGQDKLAKVSHAAFVAVSAVEQQFSNLPGSSVQKKDLATQIVQAALADVHVKVSDTVVSAAIESAVNALPATPQTVNPPTQESPTLVPGV
jgi:Bacteriophage holin of superfamily 6 (Holin_LLH)